MATQFLNVTDGRLAYDVSGDGPLVVCVPGMGDLRAQYRFLAPRLVAAGYRVATLDLRGHGESSVGWSDYGVAAIGDDILALVRHLAAGPAVIVGNSMAAAEAVWAAAKEPPQVRGLVLIGPFVRDTLAAWQRHLMVAMLFPRLWGRRVWGWYYGTLYPTAKPADFVAYRAALVANLGEPGRFAALQQMLLASKQAATERLADVHTPTLVVMGSKDPDFRNPADEATWVAGQLGGTVQLVAGAGHYPHAEFPDQTGAVVRAFLDSLATAPTSTARSASTALHYASAR